MKVAIYARLSRNPRGESTSISRQIDVCRSRIDAGWTEVGLYTDDDVSAYSDKERPEFERLLRDVEAGRVEVVVAYALDRLGRRPKDIERLLESGVRFICVRDSLDSKTASSELFIRIMAAMAKMESDNTSARIRLKHEELRRLGKWSGGRTPYGWTSEERAALRQAAADLLAGASLYTVAPSIGTDASSVRKMLLSPRMVGKREPGGAVGMPVILDEDTWRRLQRLLMDPKRRTNERSRGYLLTPLVHCGRCGSTMHGHPRQGQRRYSCRKGCGTISINADPLERLLLDKAAEEAWRRYRDADLRARTAKDIEEAERRVEDEHNELLELKERLNPLLDMYVAGSLTEEEWLRAREGLVARVEELERSLSREAGGGTGMMAVPFPEADPRQLVITMIERIDISPAKMRGRRFDPNRVDVSFR